MASVASFLSVLVDVEERSRTRPRGHLASLARLRHFICWNHVYTHIATVISSNVRDADVIWKSRIPLFSDRSLKSSRAKTESSLMMGSWKISFETPEIPTKGLQGKKRLRTWALTDTVTQSSGIPRPVGRIRFILADKTRPWNMSLGWRPWLWREWFLVSP